MKKLWLLIAGIAIVSCNDEAPIDYAIITGNIANADAKEAVLYGTTDRSFKKHTITINEDGSFVDTVKVAGQYLFTQAKNRAPLHLEAGNNITINFDAKDFDKTLTFTGKGSEISSYLVAKSNKEKELMGEGTTVYKKEEADYKKTFNEIKIAQKELLKAATGINTDYKAKEERNIQYAYLGKLNMYKSYHSYYAKKKDFEPSKEFLSEVNEIKFDNEEDFNFSSSYKSLVSSHYRNKATEIAEDDDEYATFAMLKICGDIKNQTIKNALIHEASKYNITYTADIEGFYAAYKAAGSTDAKNNAEIEKSYNTLKKLAKGKASPKFTDYENYKGGTTSLDDLKGKYTYIDVWATWCGPCKAEIPFLKKVEKQYHGKNVQFLSVSIDTKKDHQKWKDMVKEKELGGIQLFADSDWKSQFIQDYLIKGIPKFILLDPQGNIVTANAPRPSNKKLVEMFKELNI
jgi:thiol-disulfide isomerase/thioredoxin